MTKTLNVVDENDNVIDKAEGKWKRAAENGETLVQNEKNVFGIRE